MSESVILCEGFHDRSFWDGWLSRPGGGLPGAGRSGAKLAGCPTYSSGGRPESARLVLHGWLVRGTRLRGILLELME